LLFMGRPQGRAAVAFNGFAGTKARATSEQGDKAKNNKVAHMTKKHELKSL